jgi:hypothetical protein
MSRHLALRALLLPAAFAAGLALADEGQASFYSAAKFGGETENVAGERPDLKVAGTYPASVMVRVGRWEVCTARNFGGRCTVLEPGEYPDILDRFGWIRSARDISSIDPSSPEYRRYWAREEWARRYGRR